METLVDGDLAANNGGWQWSASSGMDPKPLRIFNPYTQAKKFDPICKYIKYWIPELSKVSNSDLLNGEISNLEKFKRKLNNHKEILIEEYISGRELTVSTIKLDKKIHALAVTEIKSKNNFFDYKAKYSKGYAKHILPAKLNKINYAKCLKFATKAHKLLGCNSIARTDFIFDTKKNKIFFLETNTQPGLTPISLLPEQANYKGLPFSEIIFILIKNLNY